MPNNPDQRVTENDRLLISYEIRHQKQILEKSPPHETVEYLMGTGQWPVQLELAMLGEMVGECLSIKLKASDNAFGPAEPDRIVSMDAIDFENPPDPGELIEFKLENGENVEGQILSVFADKIEVDFNHPYAGRDLDIQIQIVSIL